MRKNIILICGLLVSISLSACGKKENATYQEKTIAEELFEKGKGVVGGKVEEVADSAIIKMAMERKLNKTLTYQNSSGEKVSFAYSDKWITDNDLMLVEDVVYPDVDSFILFSVTDDDIVKQHAGVISIIPMPVEYAMGLVGYELPKTSSLQKYEEAMNDVIMLIIGESNLGGKKSLTIGENAKCPALSYKMIDTLQEIDKKLNTNAVIFCADDVFYIVMYASTLDFDDMEKAFDNFISNISVELINNYDF